MKEAITFVLLVAFFGVYCETRPPVIQEKEVVREVPVEKVVEKETPVEVVKEVPVERIVVKWRTRYVDRWRCAAPFRATGCSGY